MTRRFATVAALLVAAAVAALAAQAGPPGSWTRVTDPNGRNTDEVGLARTGDGVLHVFWKRRVGPGAEGLRYTPVAPSGKVGASSQVGAPMNAVDAPAAVVLPDGRIRVFFAGLGATPEAAGVMAATGTADGAGWQPEGVRVSSLTSAVGSVGAALTAGGESIVGYTRSFVVAFHVGVSSADADVEVQADKQCCDYVAGLATDATSGQTWLAYFSNAKGRTGTWAQQVRPAVGKRLLVPGSAAKGQAITVDQRVAITARLGSPGVYVAVCQGYPTCTRALVWRVGGKALVAGKSRDVEDVSASPGPDGRIWVAWHDGRTRRIHAVRTNKAVTRVGPVVIVTPPPGATQLWKLAGDGALGPLDVLASATTGSTLSTWHTQVLPPLSLSAEKATKTVTFTVTDAGDPVGGAAVSYGGKVVTTNAAGKASAPLASGTAKATKPGYQPASAAV